MISSAGRWGLTVLILQALTYATSSRELFTTSPAEREDGLAIGSHKPRRLCADDEGNRNWTCSNWAGTVRWTPKNVVIPQDGEELEEFLRQNSAMPSARSMKVRQSLRKACYHNYFG